MQGSWIADAENLGDRRRARRLQPADPCDSPSEHFLHFREGRPLVSQRIQTSAVRMPLFAIIRQSTWSIFRAKIVLEGSDFIMVARQTNAIRWLRPVSGR